MSFPRYPEYRDSGVEWLGEVPGHWAVTPVSYRYEVLLGKMLDEKRITGKHLAPYLRNVDVQWDRINTEDLPQMDFAGEDLARYTLAHGDLLVCEGGEVGRAAMWRGELAECYYQKALHRLRRRDQDADFSRFMFYVLRTAASRGVFESSGGKSTIAHLTAEALRRHRFAFPPSQEQAAVVAFLDRETAKIDALVEEQKRLIELLKEKRQAVISQAVTKGLDPNVPMKDSGVEWLEEVPAHWDLGPLKRFWSVTDCKHITAEFVEDGLPLASIREVQGWTVNLKEAKQTTQFFYDQLIEGGREPMPGDIIFTRNATVGEAALVPDDSPTFAMGQDVCLLRRRMANYSPDYMLHQIKSDVIRIQLNGVMVGSTFKRVNVDEIRSFIVCIPPVHEQREIASRLCAEATRFHELIEEAMTATLLLQERRAALISAAVTGKIDVRKAA